MNVVTKAMCVIAALGLIAACSSDDTASDSTSGITISGTMGVSLLSTPGDIRVSAVDLSLLKMYCVAFDVSASSGSSDFSDAGAFSVAAIPASTPFGCFVVKKADSAIVATVKVKGSGSGLEDTSTGSLNLKESVSLGTITLTEGSPIIEVPESRIADAIAPETAPTIAVADLHESGWTLSCVDSTDTDCAAFIVDSPEVYLRIISATKSSQTLYGFPQRKP